MKPDPEIHLVLIYPQKKLNIHKELKEGSSLTLYKLGSATIRLHLSLRRDQNQITSHVSTVIMEFFFFVSLFT